MYCCTFRQNTRACFIRSTVLFSMLHPSTITAPSVRMTRTGPDVFAASLPPGSTSSAPKRRSCLLLKGIEDYKPQSFYSDVLVSMCVNGKGDFSMMIENAFAWGKSDKGTEKKSRGRPAQEEVEHADRRMGRDVAKLWSILVKFPSVHVRCLGFVLQHCNRVLSR